MFALWGFCTCNSWLLCVDLLFCLRWVACAGTWVVLVVFGCFALYWFVWFLIWWSGYLGVWWLWVLGFAFAGLFILDAFAGFVGLGFGAAL